MKRRSSIGLGMLTVFPLDGVVLVTNIYQKLVVHDVGKLDSLF
jgi:hypothetical protein